MILYFQRFSLILGVIFPLFLGYSALNANTSQDESIQSAVKTKLADDSLLASKQITVEVKSGIVKLSGVVETGLQTSRAIELAMECDGVVDVDATQLRQTKETAYLESSIITAKVKGKISYLSLKSEISNKCDIRAETKNRVVYLKGQVPTAKDKSTIVDTVQKIQGVKAVKTDIQITG